MDKRYKDIVGILPGRFSGLTKAHSMLIDIMSKTHEHSYLIVVKGIKSSTDLERNPFQEDLQWQMIKQIVPTNVEPIIIHNNLIDNLTTLIKLSNHKKFAIYIGPDRLKKIQPAIKTLRNETHKQIFLIDTGTMLPRDPRVSGTAFRKALRNGDREAFAYIAPEQIFPMFDELRNYIQK